MRCKRLTSFPILTFGTNILRPRKTQVLPILLSRKNVHKHLFKSNCYQLGVQLSGRAIGCSPIGPWFKSECPLNFFFFLFSCSFLFLRSFLKSQASHRIALLHICTFVQFFLFFIRIVKLCPQSNFVYISSVFIVHFSPILSILFSFVHSTSLALSALKLSILLFVSLILVTFSSLFVLKFRELIYKFPNCISNSRVPVPTLKASTRPLTVKKLVGI